MLMANIIQEIQAGKSAVTELRKPSGLIQSHTGEGTRLWAHWECLQPFSTIRTSSVERREYKPGGRAQGRGPPGTRRPLRPRRWHIRRAVPAATNLGVSLQRSHLESDQFSRPPAPLPPAVSSHPTLSSKNTAEAEKFLTTPKATVSHWQEEKTEFWVRVPPSCPAEGRGRTVQLQQNNGAGNPPRANHRCSRAKGSP